MFVDNFTLSRYDTWEIDAMLEQIERPNPWLTRTFFPNQRYFQSSRIEFDLLDRGPRMAPFVSPLVAGKPMRREGFRTKTITPAYIKPYDLILPQDSFTRLAGEGYGGRLTPQQRFDRIVAEQVDLHHQAVDVRIEWMSAQALVLGGITISGEDYPTTYVDFGRDPSLFSQLTGASRWSQATSAPLGDIEANALNVRMISKGAVVTDLLMDGLSYELLRQHSSINDLINVFYRRSLPGQPQTAIDAGPRNNVYEPQYMGTLNGRFDIWVYDAYYQDDSAVSQPFIPPYTVMGISRAAIEGTQYFGAILDLEAGLDARRIFTKSKVKWNPSGLELVSQSAPLVAPKRPDAMFTLTVN